MHKTIGKKCYITRSTQASWATPSWAKNKQKFAVFTMNCDTVAVMMTDVNQVLWANCHITKLAEMIMYTIGMAYGLKELAI